MHLVTSTKVHIVDNCEIKVYFGDKTRRLPYVGTRVEKQS